MSELTSETVLIEKSVRQEIVALALPGVSEYEIQVRDEYYHGDVPFEGITIHDIGETYDDGVIGFEDVGYRKAVTLVETLNGDAIVTSDRLPTWREHIRRRFQNRRIPVGESDGIRHHICRVVAGEPKNVNRFPNHRIQQLVIVVWNREERTSSRTRP